MPVPIFKSLSLSMAGLWFVLPRYFTVPMVKACLNPLEDTPGCMIPKFLKKVLNSQLKLVLKFQTSIASGLDVVIS